MCEKGEQVRISGNVCTACIEAIVAMETATFARTHGELDLGLTAGAAGLLEEAVVISDKVPHERLRHCIYSSVLRRAEQETGDGRSRA